MNHTKLLCRLVVTCGCLALSATAMASIHLGKQGTVFPIIEPDMRIVMATQLASNPKYAAAKKKLQKEGVNWYKKRPQLFIPTASKSKTIAFTPKWTLKKDKRYLAKQADGSWKWTILYPKGTVVYPLRSIHLQSWLFVFNPASNKQTQLAKDMAQLASKNGVSLKLIATGGNLYHAMKIIKHQVFKLPARFLNVVSIPSIPALIGQKPDVDDHLTIAMQAPPFNAKQLMRHTQ